MTREQAEQMAKLDEGYRARKVQGRWVVWCDASDHVVEFDEQTVKSIYYFAG